MIQFKEYLGDGVYAAFDGDRESIVLTTENGISVTNTIYLEPEILEALKRYLDYLVSRIKEEEDAG